MRRFSKLKVIRVHLLTLSKGRHIYSHKEKDSNCMRISVMKDVKGTNGGKFRKASYKIWLLLNSKIIGL